MSVTGQSHDEARGGDPAMTAATVVRRRGDPLAANVGGRVVLMSPSAGNYYDLDEIGTDIWERLAQPTRVDDLCAALAKEYDANAETIERDVLALLRELARHELVEVDTQR